MTQSVKKARNGDMVVFAINGVLAATWFSRLPDIKTIMEITPAQLSLLLLGIAGGSLIALPLAGRVLQQVGSVLGVRIGVSLSMVALLLAAGAVTLQKNLWPAIVALFIMGLGLGLWDVGQNLEGTVIERALGRSIMPWFHAAFSGGTLIGAGFAIPLVHFEVSILIHCAAVAVLSVALAWWGTSRFEPAKPEHAAKATSRQRSAWSEPRTLLVGVMVLAAAFTEGAANDWLAIAFVEGHETSKTLGVVAFAVFLTFMTAGRIAGTFALDRFGRVVVLRMLFASAVVGSALVVFGSTSFAFVGAAIWGVGASLGFPVGMSAAADDPARAAARLSVVATIGYLAFLGGPPLLGFLGNEFGVLRSLVVVGLVSVLALLVVPTARPLRTLTN